MPSFDHNRPIFFKISYSWQKYFKSFLLCICCYSIIFAVFVIFPYLIKYWTHCFCKTFTTSNTLKKPLSPAPLSLNDNQLLIPVLVVLPMLLYSSTACASSDPIVSYIVLGLVLTRFGWKPTCWYSETTERITVSLKLHLHDIFWVMTLQMKEYITRPPLLAFHAV